MALYREVGSPEVMVAQLEHLLAVARLPHVTVHVVPAVAHTATGAVLEVTPEASYTEHLGGGSVYIEEYVSGVCGALDSTEGWDC